MDLLVSYACAEIQTSPALLVAVLHFTPLPGHAGDSHPAHPAHQPARQQHTTSGHTATPSGITLPPVELCAKNVSSQSSSEESLWLFQISILKVLYIQDFTLFHNND